MEIPKKFKNQDGTLNAEALIKSYDELQKKIGGMISVPDADADDSVREKFARAIGVPEDISEYPTHPMFDANEELLEKFKSAGFNKTQVEQIYELASQYLTPAIEELFSARHESDSFNDLEKFFGGPEKLFSAMNEINSFGEKFLPNDTFESLSSSVDGIKSIYSMMQSIEPNISTDANNPDLLGDGDLRNMMRNPKYWRDMDAEYIRKIENGFKKLYS